MMGGWTVGVCGVAVAAALSVAADAAMSGEVLFVDRTDQAGLAGAVHQPADLVHPIWNIYSTMSGGGAVGDFNGNGYQDIFFLTSGGAPDRLYINQGDGTFIEQAASWGVAAQHFGMGAAVADTNNNGHLDLYVTSLGVDQLLPGRHRLYVNTGKESFVDMAVPARVNQTTVGVADGTGAAFGDYEINGSLDLFVCGWIVGAAGDRLFRNQGDGMYTDVTADAGVLDANIFGFAPRFVDMNGDRYPDLLIAADFSTSRYFVNNRDGTFTNMTEASGTGLDDNGMGQTIGDFTGNGRHDWYVTSIYSEIDGVGGVPGTGNMLYLNQGDHFYIENSVDAGVNVGGWGWGTVAVDVNHDGRLDIVETNGWPEPNAAGEYEWLNEPSYLFLNQGDGTFVEAAMESGLDHTGQGRGLLAFDYENNGRMDLLIFGYNEQIRLYRNETEFSRGSGNWLKLTFDTSANQRLAPDGYGTRVIVTVNGVEQMRELTGGDNYLSQSELSLHFGVGSARVIDEVRIEWADGIVTTLTNVAVNQSIHRVAGPLGDLSGSGQVDSTDLLHLLQEWGACHDPADCPADLSGNGAIGPEDLAILLANWTG